MEKKNKQMFKDALIHYDIDNLYESKLNWEMTENGKHFNIIIPAEILELTIATNEKIVFGLLYSLNKIGGITYMNNKRMAKYLCLTENTISTTLRSLTEHTFIEYSTKGHIINEEVLLAVNNSEQRAILLPYEIFNSKLPSGAKLLWGEYNSLSKGEKPYFASRDFIYKRLKISKSSISNYTTLLHDNQYLTENILYSGYKFKTRAVITKRFERNHSTNQTKT